MTEPLVLTNAWIVSADKVFSGSLEILGDHIVAAYRGATSLPGAIDCDGDYLLPGLIDIHSDNLDRHCRPCPGVRWPVLSALIAHDVEVVGAGITTAFDALTVGDSGAGTERFHEASEILGMLRAAQSDGLMRSCHRVHLRCELSDGALVETALPLLDDPLVGIVSLVEHAPEQRQVADPGHDRRWDQDRRRWSDATMDVLIDRHQRSGGEGLADGPRATLAEVFRRRGLPLASHDDATAEQIWQAAALGVRICQCPTTEAAAAAARAVGLGIVGSAADVLLGGSRSESVSMAALARVGLLDGMSSDYSPGSLLQAVFALHRPPIRMSLPAAVATASATPARLCGLPDRGEIAPGKRADVIRIACVKGFPAVRAVWRSGRRVF